MTPRPILIKISVEESDGLKSTVIHEWRIPVPAEKSLKALLATEYFVGQLKREPTRPARMLNRKQRRRRIALGKKRGKEKK